MRVVFVSSSTARTSDLERHAVDDYDSMLTSGLPKDGGYAETKLANAANAWELHRRLSPLGVAVVAVDPGCVASPLWRNHSESGSGQGHAQQLLGAVPAPAPRYRYLRAPVSTQTSALQL